MGKKLYQKVYVSPEKTEKLHIPELLALGDGPESTDDSVYKVVHSRYFSGEKPVCPTCMGSSCRVSKVVQRKFKDILPSDTKKPKVVDLMFSQRYYKCSACGNRVFPEAITFAESGCKYTNRLSDRLADGTLLHSYQKVCNYYGVPASKASVGVIMRRRLQHRFSQLAPLTTPQVLGVFEVQYYGNYYPIVVAVSESMVHFIDILPESSESAYLAFFSQMDRKQVAQVFIDPIEQLHNAAKAAFPSATVAITEECLMRYIRDAFSEVIQKDGKHCGIYHRIDTLTRPEGFLTPEEKRSIDSGLSDRPRLRAAHNAYQDLLQRMNGTWRPDLIEGWIRDLDEYLEDEVSEGADPLLSLVEFNIVSDVLELYRLPIDAYLNLDKKPPALYASAISGIIASIKQMPFCIYDVLRARMLLNIANDSELKNGMMYRTGIRYDLLTDNMNRITTNILEERNDDGYEPEDSAGRD